MAWLTMLWAKTRDSLWFLPCIMTFAAIALAVGVTAAEREDAYTWVSWRWWGFGGGVEGARGVLSAIAGGLITVTGVTFSVTIVALQLASSQFTPRILGSFLDSRTAQVTLGVFTGSFIYSLTVLRVVRGGDAEEEGGTFVPEAAVSLSYFYVLASVGMFLAFIHHITSRVQVSRVISDLGRSTVRGVTSSCDESSEEASEDTLDWPAAGEGQPLHLDQRHGHVVMLDATGLVGHAEKHDLVVHLDMGVGDFLVPGQCIGRVIGGADGAHSADDQFAKAITDNLRLGRERDLANDPLFGTRQLVDIAERALSAGINDPTTAAQVVNELHLVLRALSCRPDPTPVLRDDDDRPRVSYRPQTLRRHLLLAVDELAYYGKENAQVLPALQAVLEEVARHALPVHQQSLQEARQRLDRATETAQ